MFMKPSPLSPPLRLQVNVAALLESLLVYGAGAVKSTSLALVYDVNTLEDSGLTLFLEESGVMTETQLRVVEAEGGGGGGGDGGSSLEAAFQASERIARVVVASPALHEVLKDVSELKGGGSVAVSFTPAGIGEGGGAAAAAPARFRLHLPAAGGSLTVDIPGNSPEVLSMSVTTATEHRYAATLLEAGLRGLGDSYQTLIRVNAAGVLSLTHKLGSTDRDGAAGAVGSVGLFVTTLIMPDELDDDEAAAARGGDAPDDEEGDAAD
jgi:hypothetical protein